MRRLLVLHALLLLLASTGFTIVTCLFGGGSLHWCWLKYASQSGFGRAYHSEFSLPVVLTYIVAFSVGLVGFALGLKTGRKAICGLGAVLSAVGLVSFLIEGSHWVVEHHRSWLAFSPAVMFALVLIACWPRRTETPARLREAESGISAASEDDGRTGAEAG